MAWNGERQAGTGVLFSENVPDGSSKPNWQGELKLAEDARAGDVIKIAAWTKQSARGPLLSIKQNTWKPDGNYKQNRQPTPSNSLDDDSDVPF
jgi:hypothetical protein